MGSPEAELIYVPGSSVRGAEPGPEGQAHREGCVIEVSLIGNTAPLSWREFGETARIHLSYPNQGQEMSVWPLAVLSKWPLPGTSEGSRMTVSVEGRGHSLRARSEAIASCPGMLGKRSRNLWSGPFSLFLFYPQLGGQLPVGVY